MFEDKSLLDRKYHGLCNAVEKDGTICFNKKRKKGYCEKHHARFRKYGSIDLPEKVKKKCKFIGCDLPHHARQCCKYHYLKYFFASKNKSRKCDVEACSKKRHAQNRYCSMHAARIQKHGSLDLPKFIRGSKKGEENINKNGLNRKHTNCIAPGCGIDFKHAQLVKGLCRKHYFRWIRYGDYNISSKKEYEAIKSQGK